MNSPVTSSLAQYTCPNVPLPIGSSNETLLPPVDESMIFLFIKPEEKIADGENDDNNDEEYSGIAEAARAMFDLKNDVTGRMDV